MKNGTISHKRTIDKISDNINDGPDLQKKVKSAEDTPTFFVPSFISKTRDYIWSLFYSPPIVTEADEVVNTFEIETKEEPIEFPGVEAGNETQSFPIITNHTESPNEALYNAVYGADGIQDEKATFLLNQGADYRTLGSETELLLRAIDNAAWKFANALIDKGLKVNQLDLSRRTLLHHAAKDGDMNRVKALISLGANPCLKDENDFTPLHLAALKGHANVVSTLVRADAPINAIDYLNRTPLFLAGINDHASVVNILVNNKANVNIPSNQGKTLLEVILYEEKGLKDNISFDIVRALLVGKPKIDFIKDPLELMYKFVKHGQLDLLESFIKSGLNKNVTDHQQETLLHKVVRSRPRNLSGMTLPVVEKLLQLGFSATHRDKSQSTPLHYATNPVDAQALIAGGGSLEATNNLNQTPLFKAASAGNEELVDYFLNKGANPYHLDSLQLNLIHAAKESGTKVFIKNLKKKIGLDASNLEQIERFFRDLFSTCLQEADIAKKKLIIVLGETHNEYRGVQIEKIAFKVAKELGILNHFVELKLVDSLVSAQHSRNCSYMPLKASKKQGFSIIGVDNNRSRNLINDVTAQGMERRNKGIHSFIEQVNQHGILSTGSAHVRGLLITQETQIDRSRYFVVPICLSDLSDKTLAFSFDPDIQFLKGNNHLIQFSGDGFDAKQAEEAILHWNKASITLSRPSLRKGCL